MKLFATIRFVGGPLTGVERLQGRGFTSQLLDATGNRLVKARLIPWDGVAGAARYERAYASVDTIYASVGAVTEYNWNEYHGLPTDRVERGAVLLRSFLEGWDRCQLKHGATYGEFSQAVDEFVGQRVHPRDLKASMLLIDEDYIKGTDVVDCGIFVQKVNYCKRFR